MIAEPKLAEYLYEMRAQVCSRCVERPPGRPPCAPLGKACGVEMHLADLVDSIHHVHSGSIVPYLDRNRQQICEKCAFLHSSICPCPMDYLAVLVVEAVETVDRRHPGSGTLAKPGSAPVGLAEVRAAYEEAVGTWTGCDWTTRFGKTGLDLKNYRAAEARALAAITPDPEAAAEWHAAACWLASVERNAQQAEAQAALALAAAQAGSWREALTHAEWAAALEFATGRPLWHTFPTTWQRLRQAVEQACLACSNDFPNETLSRLGRR